MNTELAIKNLEVMSFELKKASNDPKQNNLLYLCNLKTISYEMQKLANELKTLHSCYGVGHGT